MFLGILGPNPFFLKLLPRDLGSGLGSLGTLGLSSGRLGVLQHALLPHAPFSLSSHELGMETWVVLL